MAYPNSAAERARKGMTLDELASAIGVNRKTIYNWEHNGHVPQSALVKMADMFNCSVDYLLEGSK